LKSATQSLINISPLSLKTLVGLSNKCEKVKQVQREILLKVSGPVNKVCSFLLEFYVRCTVPQKSIFLLLTQEHIYTIEFHSLATTKRRKIIRVQIMRVFIKILQ